MEDFIAIYVKGVAKNKEQAAKLLNSDNIIGDLYEVKTELVEAYHKAFPINKFGESPVLFDKETSRSIDLMKAKGLNIVAFLSTVGFTETNAKEKQAKLSNYWGEFLIIGYNNLYKRELEEFFKKISENLANGKRPDLNINKEEFRKIIRSKGEYFPKKIISVPKKIKGTVYLRTRKTIRDKVIEQGRKKNIGCYIISWVFLLSLVTVLIYIIFKFIGIS